MKWNWLGLAVGALIGLQGSLAVAQEEQGAAIEPKPKAAAARSLEIGEILRMVQAGVSRDVVRAYIEHAPGRFDLSAADIIALKEQAVPDDVTVALVHRWAAQTQRKPGAAGSAVPGNSEALNNSAPQGFVDPESYDFWWYYYAYPRALAAANERLLSSYYPYQGFPEFVPYPYGGFYQYAPLPFRPGPWARRFQHVP